MAGRKVIGKLGTYKEREGIRSKKLNRMLKRNGRKLNITREK